MAYGVCKAFGATWVDDDDYLVANPECVCPTAMAAMVCAMGHILECHYPMTCKEAECGHYKRNREAAGDYDYIEPGDVP